MPIKTSAKKALKRSLKKREQNLFHKRRIKDLQKKIEKLIKEKKIEEAKNLLPQYYKFLDKAAKEGVIKKNEASRRKSKMAKKINSFR